MARISTTAFLKVLDAELRTVDGVNIGSTNAAALNGDVDVTILELLELKLLLLEVLPVLLVLDHEALGSLWVTHLVEYAMSILLVWCRSSKWEVELLEYKGVVG